MKEEQGKKEIKTDLLGYIDEFKGLMSKPTFEFGDKYEGLSQGWFFKKEHFSLEYLVDIMNAINASNISQKKELQDISKIYALFLISDILTKKNFKYPDDHLDACIKLLFNVDIDALIFDCQQVEKNVMQRDVDNNPFIGGKNCKYSLAVGSFTKEFSAINVGILTNPDMQAKKPNIIEKMILSEQDLPDNVGAMILNIQDIDVSNLNKLLNERMLVDVMKKFASDFSTTSEESKEEFYKLYSELKNHRPTEDINRFSPEFKKKYQDIYNNIFENAVKRLNSIEVKDTTEAKKALELIKTELSNKEVKDIIVDNAMLGQGVQTIDEKLNKLEVVATKNTVSSTNTGSNTNQSNNNTSNDNYKPSISKSGEINNVKEDTTGNRPQSTGGKSTNTDPLTKLDDDKKEPKKEDNVFVAGKEEDKDKVIKKPDEKVEVVNLGQKPDGGISSTKPKEKDLVTSEPPKFKIEDSKVEDLNTEKDVKAPEDEPPSLPPQDMPPSPPHLKMNHALLAGFTTFTILGTGIGLTYAIMHKLNKDNKLTTTVLQEFYKFITTKPEVIASVIGGIVLVSALVAFMAYCLTEPKGLGSEVAGAPQL